MILRRSQDIEDLYQALKKGTVRGHDMTSLHVPYVASGVRSSWVRLCMAIIDIFERCVNLTALEMVFCPVSRNMGRADLEVISRV